MPAPGAAPDSDRAPPRRATLQQLSPQKNWGCAGEVRREAGEAGESPARGGDSRYRFDEESSVRRGRLILKLQGGEQRVKCTVYPARPPAFASPRAHIPPLSGHRTVCSARTGDTAPPLHSMRAPDHR